MKKIGLLILLSIAIFFTDTAISRQKMLLAQQEEEIMEEESKPKQKEEKKIEQSDEKPAPQEEMKDEKKQFIFEDVPRSEDERMKFFREKYELLLDNSFEDVWNAVKQSVEDVSCLLSREKYSYTDEGLYKGIIQSDFCVFAQGEDTTFKNLKLFSLDMPTVRGGIWVAGRMQYKFVLNETKEGKVKVLLKGEVSGIESHVTNRVHFWGSNGYLETKMLERIKRKLGIK